MKKDSIKKILKKRPSLKSLKRPSFRRNKNETLQEVVQSIPRITNETVAEHREEVLSSARKYIYPLQHSAHRVVIISISLLVVVIVAFFTYCILALYKFQTTSMFLYRVSQVIPFPIAKAGPRYVAYENYLFELRHFIHYYQTQQRVDFSSESGEAQLNEFRKRAMDRVVDYAYVKELAKKRNISVSDTELNDAIRLVRAQNRLGSNDQVFEDVLKEFWGWSVSDFKRELRQQMLAQKVIATLDETVRVQATEASRRLQAGEDFAVLAKQYSADVISRDNGGNYGSSISQSDRTLSPQVIDALFKLQPGQISEVINTGSGLEIIKVIQKDGTKVQAAHISFVFKPITDYINPLKNKDKPDIFIGQ